MMAARPEEWVNDDEGKREGRVLSEVEQPRCELVRFPDKRALAATSSFKLARDSVLCSHLLSVSFRTPAVIGN